eukprot:9113259-Alexandrium_andersonii.AAC.1
MSASLVGSEMCIRDRSPPQPIYRPLRTRRRTARSAPSAWAKHRRQAGACLLYTSDAADDM